MPLPAGCVSQNGFVFRTRRPLADGTSPDGSSAATGPSVFESSVGHFNLYDDGFEAASAAMADFLKDELFRKDE